MTDETSTPTPEGEPLVHLDFGRARDYLAHGHSWTPQDNDNLRGILDYAEAAALASLTAGAATLQASVQHFAPWGSVEATCGEAVPRSLAGITDRRDETTCPSCRARFTNPTDSSTDARVIRVHHHDIEAHAASFNDGYDTAMAQDLAADPALAADWLEAHDAGVKVRVLNQAAADARAMHDPVAPECEEWALWLEARAARVDADALADDAEPLTLVDWLAAFTFPDWLFNRYVLHVTQKGHRP